MKFSVLSFLVLGILFLASCGKDITDRGDEKVDEIELREGNLMDKKGCFDFVFPIGIVFPDGTILEAENEEEMRENIKSWYANHPDVKERPGLDYPVKVTFEGDKSKLIANQEQMMRLKKYCDGKFDRDRKVCFKLIYPLTYLLPDGTSITSKDASEIRNSIKAWYEENPDSKEKPLLSYPVDVKIVNGDVITINSEDQMIALKKRCAEKETDERPCFKMDFPINFEMPDGSTIIINNDSEMESSIKAWYVVNPDNKEKPNLIYPVDVIFSDGKTKTINNEEEMIKLKKWCGDN